MADEVEYACEVREVFSGDDLIAMVDLGVENLHKKVRLRLSGVDTPPAINATKDTEAGRVRTLVRNMTRMRKAKIKLVSRNTNSWLVVLSVETHEGFVNVNDFLIKQGYEFKRAPAQ